MMRYIPITPQDAIFNHPSCGKFENVLQSKKLEILQVFLRFFSIRTFQLLAIWMLKSRILRCNGYILFILTMFFMLRSVTLFAADQTVCEPVILKSQNKNIVLPGVEQSRMMQVYFFKNISAQSIWLDHPEHRSANAGWSSYLRPGHSSALLVNRKNFSISCAVIKPGKVEYLDCAKEIMLCKPKEVTMATKPRKGTYWLVEDKAWDDLIKSLAKRGVEIK